MKKLDRVGEKFTTNEGCKVEIIEYFNHRNCTIKFENEDLIIHNLRYGDLKRGEVKNYYHTSVFNKGYLGIGLYNTKDNKNLYKTWKNLITRCYDEKLHIRLPTYKGVTICEEWYSFQNFAEWYEENYKPEFMKGWDLDKDILIKDNRTYSPSICCFVPQEINKIILKREKSREEYPIGTSYYKRYNKFCSVFTKNGKSVTLGYYKTPQEAFEAYKIVKELYIKEVANKYKNQLTTECYTAMLNYKIEITG